MEYPKAGTREWLEAKSTGPKWQYLDARGVEHSGYMGQYSDLGGTDQTAFMYDETTGALSCVSGCRLKGMKIISS